MQRVTALILAACCTLAPARAQPPQDSTPPRHKPFVLTVLFENDSTFLKPNKATDRHYTHGTKFTFAHQPRWAERLAPLLPFSPATGDALKTAAGYAFGQNIYTPDRIELSTLQPNDQPYAGWLYIGAYLQRASATVFDHFEVNLGLIGPSALAEDIQHGVHDTFDETEPRGWDHQLGDEPGIDFIYQRKWKITLLTSHGADAVQLISQAGFTLGTIRRHANAGALVRMGVNLPDDFGPGRIEEPAAATGLPHASPGAYVFVRLGAKAVEHNTILEGNNHKPSHGVDAEDLVGEVQVGLVILWGEFELGYSQTYLTRQFKGQQDQDSFGALTVSWTGAF